MRNATLVQSLAIIVALNVPTKAHAGCMSGDGSNTTAVMYALGHPNCRASAEGGRSVAVGFSANSAGPYSVAVGESSWSDGSAGIAVGDSARASAAGHIAIGLMAGSRTVGARYGISMGTWAQAFGGSSVAIGGADGWEDAAYAAGYRSIAVGVQTEAWDFGTSVGFKTTSDFAATAIGTDATALGRGSTALGRFSKTNAVGAVAIGEGAVARQPHSVAIGSQSLAGASNTVSVGSAELKRRIVFVAPGVAGTDAVNLAQAKQIAAAAARQSRDESAESTLVELRQQVAELKREIAMIKRRYIVAAD